MRYLYLVLIFAVSFLLSILLVIAEERKVEKPLREERAVKKEVEILISLPTTCTAGESIPLCITITNNSKIDVFYDSCVLPHREWRIGVMDSKGKPVPLTRFGQLRLGGDLGPRKGGWKIKDISPKQSFIRRFNLSRLFDLTIVGEYTLSVKREVSEGNLSKPFTLEISQMKFKVSYPEY